MFYNLAHHRGQRHLAQFVWANPHCHSRRGARLARRGKGTQAIATGFLFPTWVPFPRTRYRSRSPGMTDVRWPLRDLRHIDLNFQLKMGEAVAHDAGASFP
ncbi:MAG TPA: hypothetical protein VJS85_06950, partial [Rhizomicrobium sp.]|nr:hypothetical protein [Rhizomicrobium sp.]